MFGVAENDEEGTEPRFAEVECGLEERGREFAPAGAADGSAPDGELAGDIEQSPAGVAEAEHQGPFGKDLDFLRGRKDEAYVSAGASGLGVAEIGAGAGMNEGLAALGGVGPASDVDQADEVTLAIDEEEGSDAVAEPVKALDGGEAGGEAGGALDVLVGRGGLIVFGAEQEGAGRDFSVFVRRECGDAKRFEGGGNAVGADRIEVVGDDQVFGLILKAIKAVREFLIEEATEPKVDGLDDHLDHSALGSQEWRGIAGLEEEARAEPLDLDAEPIGIVMKTIVGLVGGAIPIDDAAIAGDVQERVREKMLKRAPEHHVVDAHNSRNRAARAVTRHRQFQVKGVMHAFTCVAMVAGMTGGAAPVLDCHGRPIPFSVRNPDRSTGSVRSTIHRMTLQAAEQKACRSCSAARTSDLNGFRCRADHADIRRIIIEVSLALQSISSRVCWIRRAGTGLAANWISCYDPPPSGWVSRGFRSIAGDADRPGQCGRSGSEGRRVR